jgi:branched-chain amino acid transport system ATP-binding protein
MMPLVKLEGLVAGYGEVSIVREVDLEVNKGEVVALLGPNGAGKTTTILTMAGELAPLGGVVRCLDLESNASLHARTHAGLALVTDAHAVFTRMTVAENFRVFRTTADSVLATADARAWLGTLAPTSSYPRGRAFRRTGTDHC